MRNFFFAILALTLSTGGFAQDKATTAAGPAHFARMRAQVYAEALGLDAAQQEQMIAVYTATETEVAGLRAACREAQIKVESALRTSDAEAEKVLSKEQRTALLELRRNGEFDAEVPSCLPAVNFAPIDAPALKAKQKQGAAVLQEERVMELEAPK